MLASPPCSISSHPVSLATLRSTKAYFRTCSVTQVAWRLAAWLATMTSSASTPTCKKSSNPMQPTILPWRQRVRPMVLHSVSPCRRDRSISICLQVASTCTTPAMWTTTCAPCRRLHQTFQVRATSSSICTGARQMLLSTTTLRLLSKTKMSPLSPPTWAHSSKTSWWPRSRIPPQLWHSTK